MEMYSAIYQALPKDPAIEELRKQGISSVNPAEFPFAGRKEIYVDHLESMYHSDLAVWFEEVKDVYARQTAETISGGAAVPSAGDEEGDVVEEEEEIDPWSTDEVANGSSNALSGKRGWVIELQGHHFHNFEGDASVLSDLDYVRSTILKELSKGEVKLPDGTYKFSDLGVTFPTVVRADERMTEKFIEFDPAEARKALNGQFGGMGPGGGGREMAAMMGGTANKQLGNGETTFNAKLFTFVVQMAWEPRSPEERKLARDARLQKEKDEAEALTKAAAEGDGMALDGEAAP